MKTKSNEVENEEVTSLVDAPSLNGLDALIDESESSEVEEPTPEQIENEQQRREMEEKAARFGAAAAVGFIEQVMGVTAPHLKLPEGAKENIIDKAVPVALKYGLGNAVVPEWMVQYKPEIDLGVALATTGFALYLQNKAHIAAQQNPQQNAAAQGV